MDVQAITTDCKLCSRGRFNNVTGQVACTVCAEGACFLVHVLRACQKELSTPSKAADATIALMPPFALFTGRFGPTTALVSCPQCELGTAQHLANQAECRGCPSGHFQAARGRTACTDCPANFFSAALGSEAQVSCRACSIGKYSEAQAARCLNCTAGIDESGNDYGVDMSGPEQISVGKCTICSGTPLIDAFVLCEREG